MGELLGSLTHTMLNQDISYYENDVDPEKPADQDPHRFPVCFYGGGGGGGDRVV